MKTEYSQEEVDAEIKTINNLSHIQMAELWHFSPPGHKYFDDRLPFHEVFAKRFKEFGGMTTAISKQIGWDR